MCFTRKNFQKNRESVRNTRIRKKSQGKVSYNTSRLLVATTSTPTSSVSPRTDQLEAKNQQEIEARNIIKEQIDKLINDNAKTITYLKDQATLINKNTDRIGQINVLREISEQSRVQEQSLMKTELLKVQTMAANHFRISTANNKSPNAYDETLRNINEEFNRLITQNHDLVTQLEQKKKEIELREEHFANIGEELKQSMLVQLRKEHEIEQEHQKKQIEKLIQENSELKQKLTRREKDLIDTIRDWNEKEDALKENINDQEVKTDAKLKNMIEEIERIKRSMDIETEGPIKNTEEQKQKSSPTGKHENVQMSNESNQDEKRNISPKKKQDESSKYNKKDPEHIRRPIKISYRGRLILTSFRSILDNKGDLLELYNKSEIIDFEHEGQKDWKLMFVWKKQVLRPTEEELKKAGGNMNILTKILNKEPYEEPTNSSFRKDYNSENSKNQEKH